ncbi:MAG: S-layer homology domain-containing protein [Firmicutes bacterium]|nr:S-layer homology domain-containing protein [Bacillota bacterium]
MVLKFFGRESICVCIAFCLTFSLMPATNAEAVNILEGIPAETFYPTGDIGGGSELGTILTDGVKNQIGGTNKWYITVPPANPNPKPYVVYNFGGDTSFNRIMLYAGRYLMATGPQELINKSDISVEYKSSSDSNWQTVRIHSFDEQINLSDPTQVLTVEFNRIMVERIRIAIGGGSGTVGSNFPNAFRVLEIEAYDIDREDFDDDDGDDENYGGYDYDVTKNVLFGLPEDKIYLTGGDCPKKTALVDGLRESSPGNLDTKWYLQDPESNNSGNNYAEFTLDKEVKVSRAVVCSGPSFDGGVTSDILDSFVVQYYKNNAWVAISDSQVANNNSAIVSIDFEPVQASQFRIFTQTKTRFRIREIQLEIPPVDFAEERIFDRDMYDVAPLDISVSAEGEIAKVARVAIEVNGNIVYDAPASGSTYSFTYNIPCIGRYDVAISLYNSNGKVVNFIFGSFKSVDLSGDFMNFINNLDEAKDVEYFKALIDDFKVLFPDAVVFDNAKDELLFSLIKNYLDKSDYDISADGMVKLYEDAQDAFALAAIIAASSKDELLNSLTENADAFDIYMPDFLNLSTSVRSGILEQLLEQISGEALPISLAAVKVIFERAVALDVFKNTYAPDLVNIFERYRGVCIISLSDIPTKHVNSALFKLKAMNIGEYEDIPAALILAYKSVSEENRTAGGGGAGRASISGAPFKSDENIYQSLPKENVLYVNEFADMVDFEWARESIYMLNLRGIINGREDGRFDGNGQVTRAEFVKMIVLAFDFYDTNAICAFGDVQNDSWFYEYVASAYKLGLVAGKGGGNFGAEDGITREEMAAIAYRVFILLDFEFNVDEKYSEYIDADEVSDYAKQAVRFMTVHNILKGTGEGLFRAKENATRAEAATVVGRIISFTEEMEQ